MANAVEVGGVKITPNIEVGWQKGKFEGNLLGVVSNGYELTANSTLMQRLSLV
jgi:hypothetical protein